MLDYWTTGMNMTVSRHNIFLTCTIMGLGAAAKVLQTFHARTFIKQCWHNVHGLPNHSGKKKKKKKLQNMYYHAHRRGWLQCYMQRLPVMADKCALSSTRV